MLLKDRCAHMALMVVALTVTRSPRQLRPSRGLSHRLRLKAAAGAKAKAKPKRRAGRSATPGPPEAGRSPGPQGRAPRLPPKSVKRIRCVFRFRADLRARGRRRTLRATDSIELLLMPRSFRVISTNKHLKGLARLSLMLERLPRPRPRLRM